MGTRRGLEPKRYGHNLSSCKEEVCRAAADVDKVPRVEWSAKRSRVDCRRENVEISVDKRVCCSCFSRVIPVAVDNERGRATKARD